jgi:dihydroorotase
LQTLFITRPDDWHVHFRDDGLLEHTVPATARHFARALVMPNLNPPLTTVREVIDYRARILNQHVGTHFTPFMTLFLNETVTADELTQAKQHPFILGGKLYPAGVTTNAQLGAKSVLALYPLFEVMQDINLVLQVHGEAPHGDIFERESLFLTEFLQPIIHQFPRLRIVLEHISTAAAVAFVESAPPTVAATITPQHLLFNRNQLLAGGIKPHYYCLPLLKKESDQRALQQAATSGNPKFFAGTDSAPHAKAQKENACGCAGVFSAPYAVAMYAQLFDELERLSRLNNFMSQFGASFYQQPYASETIELVKTPQCIPSSLPLGEDEVIPLAAGETLQWSIHEDD